MWTPFLLLALTATPGDQQQQRSVGGPACTACQEDIREVLRGIDNMVDNEGRYAISRNSVNKAWLELTVSEAQVEFRASIEKLENITNHLVQELDIVRSRQAASAAVQASQVIMMVTYLLTIICTWGLSRCQKVSEKAKRKEFERLEMQLRSSKARRRAAAAQEKSAQAQSQE